MNNKLNFIVRMSAGAVAVLLAAHPASASTKGDSGLRTPAAQAAKTAFAQLKQRHVSADATWKAGQPGPEVVVGLNVVSKAAGFRAKAEAFLTDHGKLVGVNASQLKFHELSRSNHRIVVRFKQVWAGREVVDRLVAVRMDHNGAVLGFVSDAMPISTVPKAAVSQRQAQHIAATWTGQRADLSGDYAAEARVLAMPNRAVPVWQVFVVAIPMRAHLQVMVDATNGSVLSVRNLVRHR